MPTFRQGDVVRVPFPYTDRSTRQFRPAVVVSETQHGPDDALLWVVMVTSAPNRPWPNDVSLATHYAEAGLPAPSIIRPAKIATIDAANAEPIGKIGPELTRQVLHQVLSLLGSRGSE